MLFYIGPLCVDTFPFEASEVERETSADYAKHDLLSTRKGYEFSGPGDGSLKISGQILPFHIGGLSELDLAHNLCEAGQAVFVTRGDGKVLDFHRLMKVNEKHKNIGPGGVGFVVAYELQLERCSDPGLSAGVDAIDALLSLFG